MSRKHEKLKEAKYYKKEAKKKNKNEERVFHRDHKGWYKVTCQAICGCCEAHFLFESKEKAEKACLAAAMKHAEITDDEGYTETVDGFYGFNIEEA